MVDNNQKKKKVNSSKTELILIGIVVISVFSAWLFFPKYLYWKDSAQLQQTKQIVIPYQFDSMLKIEPEITEPLQLEEEKTELQVIGDQFGAFGDSYGSLNTLFSGLAFAMLVASLYLQRKELQAQRLEIEDQKEEIRKSNIIANDQMLITDQQKRLIEQQLHDSKVQNFYTLLFKFLDEKQRKVEEMDRRITTGTLNGDTQFDKFINFVEIDFEGSIDKLDFDNMALDPDAINSYIYQSVLYANDQTENIIPNSEYFEYLCFILRFIESHKELGVTEDAVKVFISYQTFNEAYAMFLFSIFLDDEELQMYIKKYALLRKLNTSLTEKENFENLVNLLLGEDATTPQTKKGHEE